MVGEPGTVLCPPDPPRAAALKPLPPRTTHPSRGPQRTPTQSRTPQARTRPAARTHSHGRGTRTAVSGRVQRPRSAPLLPVAANPPRAPDPLTLAGPRPLSFPRAGRGDRVESREGRVRAARTDSGARTGSAGAGRGGLPTPQRGSRRRAHPSPAGRRGARVPAGRPRGGPSARARARAGSWRQGPEGQVGAAGETEATGGTRRPEGSRPGVPVLMVTQGGGAARGNSGGGAATKRGHVYC